MLIKRWGLGKGPILIEKLSRNELCSNVNTAECDILHMMMYLATTPSGNPPNLIFIMCNFFSVVSIKG